MLERLGRSGVAVGHHHLGQRRPVDDRPHPPAVVVGDPVQHQAFGVIHDDTHRPFLPAQFVVVEREAGAFGLGDLDRGQVGPHRAEVLGDGVDVVVASLRRQRPLCEVFDVQHFECVHIDVDHQAVERVGVTVVGGVRSPESDAALHPTAGLEVDAVVAGRPGVDLHLRRIVDAPLGNGRSEPRVLAAGIHHREQLCHADAGHHIRVMGPRIDLAAGN